MKRSLLTLLLCSPYLLVACSTGERNPANNDASEDDSSEDEGKSSKNEGSDSNSTDSSVNSNSGSGSDPMATGSMNTNKGDSASNSGSGSNSTSGMDENSKPTGSDSNPTGGTDSQSKGGGSSDNNDSTTPTDSSSNTGNSSDSTSSDSSGSNDSSGKDKEPTNLELEVSVSESPSAGGGISGANLRFAVHVQAPNQSDSDGIKSTLFDRAVALNSSRFTVDIPHPNLKNDLGDKGQIALPAVLYTDTDKNQSFGPGDKVIAALADHLVYHGPNSEQPEWATKKAGTDEVSEIKSAVRLTRLDGLNTVSEMELGGAVSALKEDFEAVALVSPDEFSDLATKFIDSNRNLDTPISREESNWDAKVENELDVSRHLNFFRGFDVHGVSWLVGYSNGEDVDSLTLSRESKIVRNICHDGRPVIAVWFSPDRWFSSSEGARKAAAAGVKPGWNLGAARRDDKGSLGVSVLEPSQWTKLSADKDCTPSAAALAQRTKVQLLSKE